MYNVALGDALHVFGTFGIHLDYTVRLKHGSCEGHAL